MSVKLQGKLPYDDRNGLSHVERRLIATESGRCHLNAKCPRDVDKATARKYAEARTAAEALWSQAAGR